MGRLIIKLCSLQGQTKLLKNNCLTIKPLFKTAAMCTEARVDHKTAGALIIRTLGKCLLPFRMQSA